MAVNSLMLKWNISQNISLTESFHKMQSPEFIYVFKSKLVFIPRATIRGLVPWWDQVFPQNIFKLLTFSVFSAIFAVNCSRYLRSTCPAQHA